MGIVGSEASDVDIISSNDVFSIFLLLITLELQIDCAVGLLSVTFVINLLFIFVSAFAFFVDACKISLISFCLVAVASEASVRTRISIIFFIILRGNQCPGNPDSIGLSTYVTSSLNGSGHFEDFE